MFNERSEVWIEILKYVVIITFFLFILAGLVCGISDAGCGAFDYDIVGDDGLGDFLVWVIAWGATAMFELVVGMATVNFLTNVRDIREKLFESE